MTFWPVRWQNLKNQRGMSIFERYCYWLQLKTQKRQHCFSWWYHPLSLPPFAFLREPDGEEYIVCKGKEMLLYLNMLLRCKNRKESNVTLAYLHTSLQSKMHTHLPLIQYWYSESLCFHIPMQCKQRKFYSVAEIKMGLLKTFHPLLVFTPYSKLPTFSKTGFPSNHLELTNAKKHASSSSRDWKNNMTESLLNQYTILPIHTWRSQKCSFF